MASDQNTAEKEREDSLETNEAALKPKKIRKFPGGKFGKTIVSIVAVLTAVGALSVLLSFYIFPVVTISGNADPHYRNGDVVLLMKPFSGRPGQLCAIKWQNKLILRRVIACSGDTVSIDETGNVFLNGELLTESYVTAKALGKCDLVFPYEVPEGKVFVLGDDRENAVDSRNQAMGAIDEDDIQGHVIGKIWPWT